MNYIKNVEKKTSICYCVKRKIIRRQIEYRMSLEVKDGVKSLDGFTVQTERVDDVPLLIGAMEKIGLHQVIDNHIPWHWKQRDLSWGWTAVIWLAYIMTEGDHRKV